MKQFLSIFLCAVFLFSCAEKKENKKSQKPKKVKIVQVEKDFIYDNVSVIGNAKANESVEITSSVSEIVEQIDFVDGERVQKGKILVKLEKTEEEAQLEATKLQLKEHERELKRIETLLQGNIATQRNYDERYTQLSITKQKIAEITAKINDRVITAPFDGVLGIRQLSVGALISPGDAITTIDDISQIKIDFNVPSIYISKLKKDVEIEAKTDALQGKVFKGKIATVSKRVDQATRSVLVRAIIANQQELLRPGMLMQVTLLKNKRKAVMIPEEATLQNGKEHFVFVIDAENKAEKREVKIGARQEGLVEVIFGLSGAEKIIIRGISKVKDGQMVEILP